EVRGAQQGPAHLLEDDDQLDVGVARAAELLGNDQALQAQLLGHLGPDRLVVAFGRLHEPAHFGLRGLVVHKPAHRLAQLLLLFTEGEIHFGVSLGPVGKSTIRFVFLAHRLVSCTTRTTRPRSTGSSSGPWTTTSTCCVARRPANRSCSTPRTS